MIPVCKAIPAVMKESLMGSSVLLQSHIGVKLSSSISLEIRSEGGPIKQAHILKYGSYNTESIHSVQPHLAFNYAHRDKKQASNFLFQLF